jgi:hypothetical protein
MKYLIQENTFREANYDNVTNALNRLGLSYTTVRVYPFIDKVTEAVRNQDETIPSPDDLPEIECDGPVFIFGSVKLARIAADKGWQPGSLVSNTHDFLDYGPKYGHNMLNSDSEIVTFFDLSMRHWEGKRFIRPTHDGKLFDADLFDVDGWRKKSESIRSNKPDLLAVYEKLQVASPKNVQKEIRVWIVNGRVITASQYRINMSYNVSSDVDPEALDFAQRMANIYCLADAFVMDVCLHEDQWKIVECGCINSAGFYLADMQRVIISLENHFRKHEK